MLNSTLANFVDSVLPGDAADLLKQDFASIDHSRQALLISAILGFVPDLAEEAVASPLTWDHLESWLGRSKASPDRVTPCRVALRPVRPDDIPQLYMAAIDPRTGHTWRYRGATVSFEQFARTLADGVLSQYSVVARDHELQGMVIAYDADMTNGHAYFAFYRATTAPSSKGMMIEGLAFFLEHLFQNFPFRHLYCEVPQYNEYLIEPLVGTGLFERVARYPGHLFSRGEVVDLSVYRLTRHSWMARFSGWDLSAT